MAIYFEKRERGESSVLSVYGTEEEITRLADDLKDGLALRRVIKNPDSRLQVPNLRSNTFDDVEVFVVDEDLLASLKRSEKKKKILIWCVWLLIVFFTILALCYAPKRG
jgi:hypothetical protein